MFDSPMAPTNAQPAAPAPAPEPYCIPLPGPSSQPAAQPAAPTARLSDYLGAAEPAAPVLDPVAAAEAAIRAEEERQSDILAFATAPPSIAHYQLDLPPRGVETSIEQEVAMRTLFLETGVPAGLGSEVSRLWNRAILNPPSDVDRTLQGKTAQVSLEQAWGPDFQKNLAAAQGIVAQMAKTRPEVVQMLEDSGLGNNVYIIKSLYNMARARRAK
jgi:hypothetical protein